MVVQQINGIDYYINKSGKETLLFDLIIKLSKRGILNK